MGVAVVDYRACVSIVKKKTLHSTMHELVVSHLEDGKKRQSEHRPGIFPTAYRTIAVVGVPLIFDTPVDNGHVEFYIRVVIIKSSLPFFTGLLTFRAMKALLNFCYSTLSP